MTDTPSPRCECSHRKNTHPNNAECRGRRGSGSLCPCRSYTPETPRTERNP